MPAWNADNTVVTTPFLRPPVAVSALNQCIYKYISKIHVVGLSLVFGWLLFSR